MPLGERIAELRKQHGIAQEDFAHKLSVSRQTLSAWENGRSRPSSRYLGAIADILDTTVDYLVGKTPAGPLETNGQRNEGSGRSYTYEGAPLLFRSGKAVWLLLVDPFAAPRNGKSVEWSVMAHYPLPRDVLPGLDSRNVLYALRMEGDSMEPDIGDGDLVCFVPESEPLNGNVMVVRYNGRLIVRGLLYRRNSDRLLMRPKNRAYDDIEVGPDDDFHVCGRIVQILPLPKSPKPLI